MKREDKKEDRAKLIDQWNRVDTLVHGMIASLDDVDDAVVYLERKYMIDCSITVVAAIIFMAASKEEKRSEVRR